MTGNKIVKEDMENILASGIDWRCFKNKTIFITGGYGMLLSYITCALLFLNNKENDYNVKLVMAVRDIDRAKRRIGPLADSDAIEFIKHDLSIEIKLDKKVDYIFHGAGPATTQQCKLNPTEVLKSNVVGTYNVLELARKDGIRSMLFFSSGAVYGVPHEERVCEEDYGYLDPLDSNSMYGESKKLAECMCFSWANTHGVPVKIVRPAHIYGPSMQIENDRRIFALIVKQILGQEEIVIESDGSGYRSFCYITDAAKAFFAVLLSGENGEAYNVGNDKNYMSIRALVDIATEIYDKKALFKNVKKLCHKNDDKMLMVSDKIAGLGWSCEYDVAEGLSRTVESYKCRG